MKIGKTFTVDAPQDKVWQFITSPEQVAPCIPGCESAAESSPGNYEAVVKTKIGPIKTTFKVSIETVEKRAPEFAKYETKGEEGSRASRVKATSTLTLKKITSTQTEVTYLSDINMMGRLGKFGSGMMQKVADGIGNQFVDALRDNIEQKDKDKPQIHPEPDSGTTASNKWLVYGGAALATIVVLVLIL